MRGLTVQRQKSAMKFHSPVLKNKELEPAADIAKRIEEHEHSMMSKLHELFGNGGK